MRLRTWTDEELIKAVPGSVSLAEILRKLGLRPVGGNYGTVKFRIKALGLDITHLLGKGYAAGRRFSLMERRPKRPIEHYLKKDTHCSSANLKRRLIREGLLKQQCDKCGVVEWQGKILALELDHIDGDRCNNELNNLRILCPNCHSLTKTYRGRNIFK